MRRPILAVAALLLVVAAGATFARRAQPTEAGVPTNTSTPTRTPTATPTPAAFALLTNTTTDPSDGLDFETIFGIAIITSQPAGCGTPMVTVESGFHRYDYPADPPYVPYTRTKFRWPTACVGVGEQVTVGWSGYPFAGAFQHQFLNTITSTSTPTPTFTPTATATYPGGGKQFTNSTQPMADGLDIVVNNGASPPVAAIVLNPPGCTAPSLTVGVRTVTSYYYHHLFGWIPFGTDYWIISVRWPTPCVNLGEQVALSVDVSCCSKGEFSLGSAPAPTATPEGFPEAGVVGVAIDCDITASGVQSNCNVPLGTTSVAVDVIVQNSAPLFQLGAFEVRINNPDESRLLAPTTACDPSGLDCNPDFNQAGIAGSGWACAPPGPTVDENPATSGQQSYIGCFTGLADGPTIPTGGSLRVARLTYSIPPGAPLGSVPLTLRDTSAYDRLFGEQMSCAPVLVVSGTCVGATITLVEAPTFTPSPTATGTNTPPPTNTSTPTPEGPRIEKQPEGNAANADLSVPKANLWICEAGPCDGPGEGALRVVEHAFGVQDGLGAYEFTVEYDNFVIQSINPCDLVFGPGGAGSTRGPVDELDASAVNADCAPDPGATNNGTCAYSLVLENLVHFGCVTSGQIPGPTGDFDLASLLLIPHPDLNNDLFPGNDNGVLTVIKDTGCELVDTLGHAVSGSINGGLTPFCRDLAVTVRILEGDLDLDCDVDLTDSQLIAARYGAFFGGLLYSKWLDLEPALHDLDIDIKDIQKVFGRQGSTCQAPVPAQPPLDPPTPFGD